MTYGELDNRLGKARAAARKAKLAQIAEATEKGETTLAPLKPSQIREAMKNEHAHS